MARFGIISIDAHAITIHEAVQVDGATRQANLTQSYLFKVMRVANHHCLGQAMRLESVAQFKADLSTQRLYVSKP